MYLNSKVSARDKQYKTKRMRGKTSANFPAIAIERLGANSQHVLRVNIGKAL